MSIQKVDPIKSAPIIFEIVKNSFNRPFDNCPNSVDEVIAYIKNSDAYILNENSQNIGYFILESTGPNKTEVKSLAVSQSFQGHGYGSILMKKILDFTKGQKVHFVTHPQNTSGLILYTKHGFIITGYIEDYQGWHQPRLKLEKQN